MFANLFIKTTGCLTEIYFFITIQTGNLYTSALGFDVGFIIILFGERGSGISVLPARHDDDEISRLFRFCLMIFVVGFLGKMIYL